MRPIAKPILTAAVILISTALAACLVLNVFLALPATREQVQRQITQAVEMPVTIGPMIGLPWPFGAIRVSDIKAGTPGGITGFTASSVTLHPNFTELLRGRITASGVDLREPSLRLSNQSDMEPIPSDIRATLPSSSPQTAPSPPPRSESLGDTAAQRPFSAAVARPVPLRSIRITGGNFSYFDGRENLILTLKGITLHASANDSWNGSLAASSAVIGSSLIVRNLRATLSAPANLSTLDLSPVTASLGGGVISGTATLSLLCRISKYSLTLRLAEARLEKLLADASIGTSSADGIISGELRLAGIAGKGSTMNGVGSLLCKEVTVEPAPFLRQIGQFLNLEELNPLRLAQGKCLFLIDQGRFVVDDLFLRSENLILAAKGPCDSTGELNLETRLLFNEKLTAKLQGLLGNKLSPAPEQGYTQILFHVSGPALNPRTDLLERLSGIRIGGSLGGLCGLIQGLFGSQKPLPPQAPVPASTP